MAVVGDAPFEVSLLSKEHGQFQKQPEPIPGYIIRNDADSLFGSGGSFSLQSTEGDTKVKFSAYLSWSGHLNGRLFDLGGDFQMHVMAGHQMMCIVKDFRHIVEMKVVEQL